MAKVKNTATRSLQKLARKYPVAFGKALGIEARGVLADSQAEVPIDTGELLESGVIVENLDPPSPNVRIGYGAEHALIVHENLDASHPVGKAKFLQDPFNKRKNGMARRIAKSTLDAVR